jgi:DMSO/TMAO reductase YedYZ molybdopterin-dependent catalytic subunit
MADTKTIKSPDTERENRVPPGQRVTEGWPVLHHGEVPRIEASKWTFRLFGLVEEEKTLKFDEFMRLPRVSVSSDIHCVTRWSKLGNLWEGVSTSFIKDLVKIRPGAGFVMVHARGGFTTNLSLKDFFAEDALFAVKHDGKELSPEHGWPVRLVVPRLYFWKSAKWVTGVEFVKEDAPGFWESFGYHMHGDPWKEERFGR